MPAVVITVVRPSTARFTICVSARKRILIELSGAVRAMVYKHGKKMKDNLLDLRYHAAEHRPLGLPTVQLSPVPELERKAISREVQATGRPQAASCEL